MRLSRDGPARGAPVFTSFLAYYTSFYALSTRALLATLALANRYLSYLRSSTYYSSDGLPLVITPLPIYFPGGLLLTRERPAYDTLRGTLRHTGADTLSDRHALSFKLVPFAAYQRL